MITENLSTLKIHKLTQEQYERELAAGRIDPNALYLTPDEEIDLSGPVDAALSSAKAYTDAQMAALVGDTKVSEQITNAIASYYTKTEIDNMELITTDDIDEICGQALYNVNEVEF